MVESVNEKELVELPLPAIVAFAARCARKVQHHYHIPKPVYQNSHPDVEEQDAGRNSNSIDMAISFAEQVAQLEPPSLEDSKYSLDDVLKAGNTVRSFAIESSRKFAA